METSYETKSVHARLILGSTSLAEDKKLRYVTTPEDVLAWKEVKSAPGDYPPANETSGCAVPDWDWRS
jgi:hypothetical protein